MWTCPICLQALQKLGDENCWACVDGHRFDIAREGYVNLLPAQHKRSKQPGDSKEMLMARRRFHDADLYHPLAEAIAERATESAAHSVLDIGCGEGYYGQRILESSDSVALFGIDIAKSGVRLAAKRFPSAQFAVASSARLPLADNSMDFAFQVFAPVSDSELRRVCKTGGHYLEAGPVGQHLLELKQALYDEVRPYSAAPRSIDGTELESEQTVAFRHTLKREQIADLIQMTPFAFGGHREKREALLQQESLEIGFEFKLRQFRFL